MRKRTNEAKPDLSAPEYFLDRDPDIRRLKSREAELHAQRKANRGQLAELHERAESETRGGGVTRRRAAAEAMVANVALVERPPTWDRIRELEADNERIEDALKLIGEDLRSNHVGRVSAEICGELAGHDRQLVSRVAAAAVELSRANTMCMGIVDTLEARGVQPSSLPGFGLRFLAGRVGTLRDVDSGVRELLREIVRAGVLSRSEVDAMVRGGAR